MKHNKALHIIGSISRTLLALTFLFSGIVKAIDPLGTVYKIEDYLKAFGGVFVDMMPVATVVAIAMIAFEWTLGFCLLLNVRTKVTAWLSLVFMLVMTPLTLYIALENPVSDCGCFGDAVKLSNWATFWKNIVLLVLVIVLLVTKKHIYQVWTWWAEAMWTIIGLGIAGGVMGHALTHLPVVDFRPYKVGNYLPELMVVPEGAPEDVYEITLIYEKDGVEQEFTLENYPQGDDSWTFVDQKSVLVQKGYEPPIHDFELINYEGENLTYDILEAEDTVTLAIVYDLEKTDKAQLPRLEELYKEYKNKGQAFYIVTGSGEEVIEEVLAAYLEGEEEEVVEEIAPSEEGADSEGDVYSEEDTYSEEEQWEELTEEVYAPSEEDVRRASVLTCDGVTLKTIVRANPGIVRLYKGVVVEKYNLKNRE